MDVKKSEAVDIVGNIIETFEEFLAEKGIEIPNEEGETGIYGVDYYNLEDAIMKVLIQDAVLVITNDPEYMDVMMDFR